MQTCIIIKVSWLVWQADFFKDYHTFWKLCGFWTECSITASLLLCPEAMLSIRDASQSGNREDLCYCRKGVQMHNLNLCHEDYYYLFIFLESNILQPAPTIWRISCLNSVRYSGRFLFFFLVQDKVVWLGASHCRPFFNAQGLDSIIAASTTDEPIVSQADRDGGAWQFH